MTRENLILNVDDYDAARYAKSRILRHAGFEVVEAVSGMEALGLVTDLRPALVLLDVSCPMSMDAKFASGSRQTLHLTTYR